MKRKWLSLLLSALLALGLCTPAFAAEESLQEELTRVTLAVKSTLSIGDSYTDFTGDVNDMGALRYWSLNWSDDAGNTLHVLATDTGKVMQYSLNSSGRIWAVNGGSYSPAFSKVSVSQARDAAEKFLDTVLTGTESAQLQDHTDGMPLSMDGSDYTISAQILLNGIPSPNRATLQVSSETGEVEYFSRDDCYEAYLNDVPSSVPTVPAETAAAALAGTVSLSLQYVLPEDGDGSTAVLRYVPVSGDDYYVDAQTGKLVNLTEAWNDARSNSPDGSTGAAANATPGYGALSDKEASLSEQELSAIGTLQGVLSQDALDTAARKVSALGLGRYTLASASYTMSKESGDITCTLTYTRKLTLSELNNITSEQYQTGSYQQTKVLELNAKTAALLRGWSYRPWYMKVVTPNRDALQVTADSFLALCYPDYAKKVVLTDGTGSDFRYDRQENGYFYHSDSVSITMDPSDGSVASFSAAWTDGLTFQPADGLISADAAKAAYCDAFATQLGYLAYPVSVNVAIPIWKTYASCCGYVAYRYELGYTFQSDNTILGVDAKTGKPIMQTQDSTVSYTDISDSYAKGQIELLASAGIGFGSSTEFKPTAQLTQKEMLVLLLNSCGYSYDVDNLQDEDTLNSIYTAAWSQGFLSSGTRNPDQAITRLEFIRSILNASPYGQAAKLKGIFVTSFTDASKIPSDSLGYAAIAQGLGMIRGNQKGQFVPDGIVTRQSAAMILYNYMNR